MEICDVAQNGVQHSILVKDDEDHFIGPFKA